MPNYYPVVPTTTHRLPITIVTNPTDLVFCTRLDSMVRVITLCLKNLVKLVTTRMADHSTQLLGRFSNAKNLEAVVCSKTIGRVHRVPQKQHLSLVSVN